MAAWAASGDACDRCPAGGASYNQSLIEPALEPLGGVGIEPAGSREGNFDRHVRGSLAIGSRPARFSALTVPTAGPRSPRLRSLTWRE
jgi:hypothetical protein